jgi:hypothetical protein
MKGVLLGAAAFGLSAATSADGALLVRQLRPFAGYTGGAIMLQAGTVIEVVPKGGDVQLKASLQGLNTFANGTKHGFHVHAGSTCDDLYGMAGAHYYEGTDTTTDPWLANKVDPDAQGNNVSDVTVAIALPDPFLLVGKAIVVHDASGVKAACGVIEESRPGVVFARGAMKPYFDLSADSPAKVKLVQSGLSNGLTTPSASVLASFAANATTLSLQASGLANSQAYTLAILNNTDCSCSGSVVAATFTATDTSILFKLPFTTTASGAFNSTVFDLSAAPVAKANVANKCAVMWLAGAPSTIVACGYVVDATKAEGAVDVTTVAGTTKIRVWASGLQMNNNVRVGAHVHVGSSCASANGLHLVLANGTDPYLSTSGQVTVSRLVAKGIAAGAAPYSRTYFEFTHSYDGATARDVAGHTFTIHDTNGNRLTCAELSLVDTQAPTMAPTAVPTTAVPTTSEPTTAKPPTAEPVNGGVVAGAIILGLAVTGAFLFVGLKFFKPEEDNSGKVGNGAVAVENGKAMEGKL